MSELLRNDVDPVETSEWLQALESLLREEGPERARFIIDQLTEQARKAGVDLASSGKGGSLLTDYINTIATSDEPAYPGNKDLEKRIRSIIRWNAAMIVLRASKDTYCTTSPSRRMRQWAETCRLAISAK